MSERSAARAPARGLVVWVDVALFTPRPTDLAVLLVAGNGRGPRGRDRWQLPSMALRLFESPDDAAVRAARAAVGGDPSLLEQAAVRSVPHGQMAGAGIIVSYFGLVPVADGSREGRTRWTSVGDISVADARSRDSVESALAGMRARVDDEPIAFRLLPTAFTLSELQSVYELLLGRRLHKASFRRSLHASGLVEAIDEWRGEGRGRPAQLFRYAPKRRRRLRRGIRFDLL